jgi:hypothetical protein
MLTDSKKDNIAEAECEEEVRRCDQKDNTLIFIY